MKSSDLRKQDRVQQTEYHVETCEILKHFFLENIFQLYTWFQWMVTRSPFVSLNLWWWYHHGATFWWCNLSFHALAGGFL